MSVRKMLILERLFYMHATIELDLKVFFFGEVSKLST